jgi:hypothetical protein
VQMKKKPDPYFGSSFLKTNENSINATILEMSPNLNHYQCQKQQHHRNLWFLWWMSLLWLCS